MEGGERTEGRTAVKGNRVQRIRAPDFKQYNNSSQEFSSKFSHKVINGKTVQPSANRIPAHKYSVVRLIRSQILAKTEAFY